MRRTRRRTRKRPTTLRPIRPSVRRRLHTAIMRRDAGRTARWVCSRGRGRVRVHLAGWRRQRWRRYIPRLLLLLILLLLLLKLWLELRWLLRLKLGYRGNRRFCLYKGGQCGGQFVVVCPCAFGEVGEGFPRGEDEDVGGCVRGEEVEALCWYALVSTQTKPSREVNEQNSIRDDAKQNSPQHH
jgi:hypothetical protein